MDKTKRLIDDAVGNSIKFGRSTKVPLKFIHIEDMLYILDKVEYIDINWSVDDDFLIISTDRSTF